MSDNERCGRPIYDAPPGVDLEAVCLMHSHDAQKDQVTFEAEIKTITAGTSAHAAPRDRIDFTKFVFPVVADFTSASFTRDVYFMHAIFTHGADFSHAIFGKGAFFTDTSFTEDVEFIRATFTQHAVFSGATFTGGAAFWGTVFTEFAGFEHATFFRRAEFRAATFVENADFTGAFFCEIADFDSARFLQPTRVLFLQVNEPRWELSNGLVARFIRCDVEAVRFSDVNWHRERGGMVLQDERDALNGKHQNYELVAETYRKLVTNFQRASAHDLAEDCIIGAMEMGRRDPRRFPFARGKLRAFYEENKTARWLAENFSALNLYRLLSNYGSSYRRAFGWLLFCVIFSAALYSGTGLRLSGRPATAETAVPAAAAATRPQELAPTHSFTAALLESFEVATFERFPFYEPVNSYGRAVVAFETIAIPAQLALLLLALSRRFRV